MLMWKNVGVSKVSVIYIYIDNNKKKKKTLMVNTYSTIKGQKSYCGLQVSLALCSKPRFVAFKLASLCSKPSELLHILIWWCLFHTTYCTRVHTLFALKLWLKYVLVFTHSDIYLVLCDCCLSFVSPSVLRDTYTKMNIKTISTSWHTNHSLKYLFS